MLVESYQSTGCTFPKVGYLQPHQSDKLKYHIKIKFNQLILSPLTLLLLWIHFCN